MADTCTNIKAILVELQGKDLSSTAKLVAILEACGITDREEVEALLECRSSTLREARRALKIQRQNSSGDGNPAPEFQRSAGNPAQTLEIQRQNSSAPSRARATKELPSEVSSYLEVNNKIPPTPHASDDDTAADTEPPSRKLASEAWGRAGRGSRLDPDWRLPDDWMIWARTNFAAATIEQIEDQAAQFRDYWVAKPGAQACKLDWEATWRNWCRRGLSPLGHVRRPQSTGAWHAQAERKITLREALNRRIAADLEAAA